MTRLEKLDLVRYANRPKQLDVELALDIDATVELEEGSGDHEAPKSLSKGDAIKFKLQEGTELKYKVALGDVTGTFKIEFDVGKDKPKLKLSEELEKADKEIGFETTTTETETEIQLSTKVEIEKKWTKGKKPEKKSTKEREHEGKALGYELEFEEETKFKQEKDESEYEVESKSEIEHKTVTVVWRIY
ncbi:hypothetical protein ABW20_dc0100745 [Dactylellina cionopaga]|nr:hypothetical protein ABW20_dc0100745 [Dactylellina cionopaga]